MRTDVLGQPTLVLNRHWQPIHVTTVVRALVLLWNDAARVVEPEEYRFYSWGDWADRAPASASLASGPHGCGCGSPRWSA